MSRYLKSLAYFSGAIATALLGAASLTSSRAVAACNGPEGTPTPTQTFCVTAVQIPGNPIRTFDISSVNTARSEYYLSDRSNFGVDIISTKNLQFLRTIPGFVGPVIVNGAVDNSLSGPNGNASFGNWLYAGDGNSTLHVINLNAMPLNNPPQQIVSTGGMARVDEMSLTDNGMVLMAVNNADDPPFGTLFNACGNAKSCTVSIIKKVTISSSIIPAGFGLGFEASVWDPGTQRFYASLPTTANNPPGCNYGQLTGAITCSGGMVVIDPKQSTSSLGLYDSDTNTGVVLWPNCGPNGITLSIHGMLMEGCTPGNDPNNMRTYVVNGTTHNFAAVSGITGSDEVWWNSGDHRYYLGASKDTHGSGSACVGGTTPCPVLGVVDETSVLIETIPQSSGSHSVAADSDHNYIFVPQVAPVATVGSGGDTTTGGPGGTTNSYAICGGNNGCVAVYQHKVEE